MDFPLIEILCCAPFSWNWCGEGNHELQIHLGFIKTWLCGQVTHKALSCAPVRGLGGGIQMGNLCNSKLEHKKYIRLRKLTKKRTNGIMFAWESPVWNTSILFSVNENVLSLRKSYPWYCAGDWDFTSMHSNGKMTPEQWSSPNSVMQNWEDGDVLLRYWIAFCLMDGIALNL